MKQYFLSDDVRLFWDSETVLRVRKGIWNHTEAVLNLADESVQAQDLYRDIANALIEKREVDLEVLLEGVDPSKEKEVNGEQIEANLQELARQGFLVDGEGGLRKQILVNLFSGSYHIPSELPDIPTSCFISDTPYAHSIAQYMAKEMDYPLERMDDTVFNTLGKVDLTNKMEAIELHKSLDGLKEKLKDYPLVLGCFLRPNIVRLRNLNRVLLELKIPLILGFIDGPFLTILATAPGEQGCFECFEHRLWARQQDTQVYASFVRASFEQDQQGRQGSSSRAWFFSPLLGMVVSAVLSEGLLYNAFRFNRIAGRVVSVYLPTLEVQAQDLLRVPYCPACGHISTAKLDNLYTNTQRVVDQMLEKIDLREE